MTALPYLTLALLSQSGEEASAHVGHLTARFGYESIDGPRDCPAAEQVKREIQSGLDYDPFQPGASLRLTIRIVRQGRDPDELMAEITIGDERGALLGQQRIRSTNGDCRALASAAAFTARLALQPLVEPAPVEVALSTPTPTAPTSGESPRVVRASEATSAPHPTRAFDWVLSIGPLFAIGASVSPNFGLMAGAEARWRRASFGLQLRADLPSSASVQGDPTATVQTSLLAVVLALCGRPGDFSLCPLLVLGRQHSRGNGLDPSNTLDTFYGAGGARIGYEFRPWRQVGFCVNGDLLIPFARTQLLVSGQPEWQTPPISVAVWGAVEWIP